MKKIIAAAIIAVLCIGSAVAERITVSEELTSFFLVLCKGSGENGAFTGEDEIIIHSGIDEIWLESPDLPEDLFYRYSLEKLMNRPVFRVDEGNGRYYSDYLGLLYEKLPDGNLRLLSVPTSLEFSNSEIIPYGVYEIPSEITSIGPGAAAGCGIDRTIAIPATLTDIDDNAFIFSGIRGFIVHPDNPRYASIDGSLYDKAEKRLLYAAQNYNEPFFEVPDGIRGIADYAFLGSEARTVSLPSTTEDVSSLSFMKFQDSAEDLPWLDMISDISIRGESDKLKLIREEMPLSSGDIWSVTFIIKDDVLVAALQSLYLDREGYIAAYEFWGKELIPLDYYYMGFDELQIPEGARRIGPYAFFGLNTETLAIPGSVKNIDGSAFAGADIDNLKLNEGTERITGYDKELDGSLPYLSEIWIPSSLKEIFGFTPNEADTLVAGYGTEYDEIGLICSGPGSVTTGDLFHISKDSPFYGYFMAIDPYAVEDTSWLEE